MQSERLEKQQFENFNIETEKMNKYKQYFFWKQKCPCHNWNLGWIPATNTFIFYAAGFCSYCGILELYFSEEDCREANIDT